MKIAKPLKSGRFLPKSRKGIALVTVLTVMSLTTILVLTFFSLATSEHRASSTYSHGLQAQQVGEEAINLVIAQIREATTAGRDKAWASQPGAIRRWDDTGSEEYAFKLYSDDSMKTLDWGEFEADFQDADKWDTMQAHFVDLNEPVIRGQKVYYPIVHPTASTVPDWPQALGDDDAGVEGFSYNQDPNALLANEGDFGRKAAATAGADDGHVAMPVKWIYSLADGTMGTLSESSSGSGTEAYKFNAFSGDGTPGEDNRIVSRFAYWADDETSKLNMNTHAGGLAWDVPKAGGALDMDMARYQPAQKEWQRYPGHPATTHLSAALAPGVLDIVNDSEAMEMLYHVVPRVVGGGSESGTRYIDTRNPKEANGLVPDKEPLFPTLDDVVMRSDRTPHEYPDPKGKPIPPDELSDYLERSKFFITVNSRAPETNLFNLPKIAIWPVYNAPYKSTKYNTYLTAFDRLIHYCASVGESPGGDYPRNEYIFKRENADSTTYDYEAIPRNKELYQYLLTLLDTKVPGYSGSFSSKYPGAEYRQILTEIFDYIRTTNLHDDSIFGEDFDRAYLTSNTDEHVTYTNPRNERNKQVGMKGHGQVVPIRIDGTKGFGRFYSLASTQVHVISCAEPGDTPLPVNMGATSYRGRNDIQPSSQMTYLNFPPHPAGVTREKAELHPLWLKTLKMSNPQAYEAAFDPANWNWQLAYLDQSYFGRVVNYHGGVGYQRGTDEGSDPVHSKFQRSALSPLAFREGHTRLENTEQLVQGMFLFNLFTPSIGWGSINPDMEIKMSVSGQMKFQADYGAKGHNPYGTTATAGGTGEVPFIGFDLPPNNEYIFATNATDSAWGGRRYGGVMPFEFIMNAPWSVNRRVMRNAGISNNPAHPSKHGGRGRFSYLDRGYNFIPGAVSEQFNAAKTDGDPNDVAESYRYDLVTVPFKIGGASASGPSGFDPGLVDFIGGEVTFEFYHGGKRSEGSKSQSANSGIDGGDLIQTIEIDVPSFQYHYQGGAAVSGGPHPRAPVVFNRQLNGNPERIYQNQLGGYFNEFDNLSKDSFGFLERNNLGTDPGNPITDKGTRISTEPANGGSQNVVANGRFAQISVHRRPSPFSPSDLVQSVEIRHGDARVTAGKAEVSTSEGFAAHRHYSEVLGSGRAMAHSVVNSVGADYSGAAIEDDYLIRTDLPNVRGADPYRNRAPLPFGVEESKNVQLYGDFDNGSGLMIDGPYINKPDEGNTHALKTKFARELTGYWEERRNYGDFPYFGRDWAHESGGPAYFSPNRLVSGPGMFGSLPTGVTQDIPWRTLLFRPNTTGGPGFATHPGAGRDQGGDDPPDHFIMDLFWMPIVEPYAISEPLSTGGKININCQIVPFLHIKRDTALRGVFKSEFLLCVPNAWHADYKHNHGRGRGYHWRDAPYGGQLQGKRLRAAIVEDKTLEQFYDRFSLGRSAFKSSGEICEIHLIPQDISERLGVGPRGGIGTYTPTVSQMENGSYWRDHSLIGDNSRERPYTNIQNRITTKSNTFLVHYRAQVLKQSRRDNGVEYGEWRPEFDSVEAEYRGSSMVERFVDPNSDVIPDFATEPIDTLDEFYQYRVVNPRRFAP